MKIDNNGFLESFLGWVVSQANGNGNGLCEEKGHKDRPLPSRVPDSFENICGFWEKYPEVVM